VQCLFQEDLLQGRLSASQFHDKLPWFLEASPTSDCAKGGHSSYQTSLNLAGKSFHAAYAGEIAACMGSIVVIIVQGIPEYD